MQTLFAYPEVTVDRHVPLHLALAVIVMVVSAAINLYTDSHIAVAACLAVLFTLPLLRPPVYFPEADCVGGIRATRVTRMSHRSNSRPSTGVRPAVPVMQ